MHYQHPREYAQLVAAFLDGSQVWWRLQVVGGEYICVCGWVAATAQRVAAFLAQVGCCLACTRAVQYCHVAMATPVPAAGGRLLHGGCVRAATSEEGVNKGPALPANCPMQAVNDDSVAQLDAAAPEAQQAQQEPPSGAGRSGAGAALLAAACCVLVAGMAAA